MRSQLALIATIITPLFLTACFGDGGSNQGNTYDGAWNVAYYDPANYPAPPSGYTVNCANAGTLPTMTIFNGSGSIPAPFNLTCNFISASAVVSAAPDFPYSGYVGISASGSITANINGNSLSGTCSGAVGCTASSVSAALTLTR